MRENNAISTKKHLVVTTGTNLFLTEYKDHEQTGLHCEAISLQTMCVKFWKNLGNLNLGKLLFCWCHEYLDSVSRI